MQQKKKVVIVGGGFGGIRTARALDRYRDSLDVILISDKTYFEYYPALYRLVTGASPIEACVSLEEMLSGTETLIVHDKIVSVDSTQKSCTGASGETYHGDALVLALGSQTAYFNIPGLPDLSFGFKSVHEALELKKHLHDLFVSCKDSLKDELVSHFHVVIVGGGASGVEVAGDMSAFLKKIAKKHNVTPSFVTIDIVEAAPRLIAQMPEKVSGRIEARLRKNGVNIFLNRALVREEVEGVYMKDMSLDAKTVIWTAGTEVNPLYKTISGFSFNQKGRVLVNEYLEAKNISGVYIVGDGADTPYTGLAQTAIHNADFVAKDIGRILVGNKKRSVYEPRKTAFVIPVGDDWAIFSYKQFMFSGWFAYLLRHVVDFQFFARTVSISTLFAIFFRGWKYRSIDEDCPLCR